MISEFIRQCPCCQVMSRLRIPIKTHPFTCASYNPFEVLHLDHIGPLRPDVQGNMFILVIIDAFLRWVELYPKKTTTAVESVSCIFQHFGRFGHSEVVHTDRGTAFHNELIAPDVGHRTVVDDSKLKRGEWYRGTCQPGSTPPPKCHPV